MGENKRHNRIKSRRIVWMAAAALLLIALIVAGVVRFYLGKISRYGAEDDFHISAEQIQQMEEEAIRQDMEASIAASIAAEKWGVSQGNGNSAQDPTDAPDESVELEGSGRDLVNILLLGIDRRSSGERGRSDTMILCTIDKAGNTITMTSFLRDLYVDIPGYESNRLNAAYQIGGIKLLNKTLKENFGVEAEANIEVDFECFKRIVDLMGGVSIFLTKAEVEYMSQVYGHEYLVPGMNHLNGDQALSYSRIRYIDSDFQRSNRQRTVLNALLDSVRDANLSQLVTLVETILPLVKTDMTDSQIMGYVLEFFSMLSDCRIESQRVPLDNGYVFDEVRGMSVIRWFPNMTKNLLIKTTQ